MIVVFIVCAISGVSLFLFSLSMLDRVRLCRKIRTQWGKEIPTNRFDSEESLSETFHADNTDMDAVSEIDDWT